MGRIIWPRHILVNTFASLNAPHVLSFSNSKLHCGLHVLIVVPTNHLWLDAPGWTEECKNFCLDFYLSKNQPILYYFLLLSHRINQMTRKLLVHSFTHVVDLHATLLTSFTESQRHGGMKCSTLLPCISLRMFSLTDQCSSHHHGCWAGVCHPAQHNWQTALWPGTLYNPSIRQTDR